MTDPVSHDTPAAAAPPATLAASVPAPAAPADTETSLETRKSRQDIISGVTLAVFAAALAICDLGGGKYGDDQILAANEKAQAYSWFQSKSVKQSLIEGEAGMLEALVSAGAVDQSKVHAIEAHVVKLEKKSAQYEKQKNEILLGSEKVGKDNWAQDQDGKFGQITGAKQFEEKANALDKAGDIFDFGTLYLQLCLVMGAIGIVMQGLRAKQIFCGVMVTLGLIGTYYTYAAYQVAMAAP